MSAPPTNPPANAPPADEKPQSFFDKIGAALPIALTALATVFAGMSSSELQRAMFWRTAAGQDQAKATNQWTFSGLKRNRSLTMEGAGAAVAAAGGFKKLQLPTLSASARPEEKEALEWLSGKGPPREKVAFIEWYNFKEKEGATPPPPPAKMPPREEEALKALLEAIRARAPEADILEVAAKVTPKALGEVIDNTEKEIEVIDTRWDKVVKAAAKIVAEQTKKAPLEASPLQAARFDMEQRRYRSEGFFTNQLGFLYEARVRVVTAVSDHHRKRSENFFYAMLVAQIGAVISSLALARKQKSALWLLAGVTGAIALGFGAFVYVAI